MDNKELMLWGVGKSYNTTHYITIAHNQNGAYGFTFNLDIKSNTITRYGSISPETLSGYKIEAIHANISSQTGNKQLLLILDYTSSNPLGIYHGDVRFSCEVAPYGVVFTKQSDGSEGYQELTGQDANNIYDYFVQNEGNTIPVRLEFVNL